VYEGGKSRGEKIVGLDISEIVSVDVK